MTIILNNKWFVCSAIIFILGLKIAFGQTTGDPQEDFFEGEFYVSQGMFADALPYYLAVLKKDPENSNINYRVGLCYMKQAGEESKALPYLQKAILEINPKYIEGKYKSTGAPPETWILLGDAYFHENDLIGASDAYNKYRDLIGSSDKKKLGVITERIDAVSVSSGLQQTSQNLQVLNMGNVINSKFSEYHAVMSADENTLVYTQDRDSYEKILITHRTDGVWSPPLDITKQIGSDGDCYSTGISSDGTSLLIIGHDAFISDIYTSDLVKGKWQKMKPIAGKINTRNFESGACLSPDGKYLYFSSDKPKGIGGFDLYVAEKIDDNWENIRNLGSVINTVKDEVAPFISSDGSVLYFCSNGHPSIGSMDVFYSVNDGNGNWQTPVNPGKPISTTQDELSYIYFDGSKTGYISRYLTQGVGKSDLYTVTPLVEEVAITEPITSPVEETPIATNNVPESETMEAINPPGQPSQNINPAVSEEQKMPAVIEEEKTTSTINTTPVQAVRQNTTYEQTREEQYVYKQETTAIYTIQIMALMYSNNPGKIKLSSWVVSRGDDGFTRFTYGEFKSMNEARASLKKVKNKGYRDAFIRKIDTISNYASDN